MNRATYWVTDMGGPTEMKGPEGVSFLPRYGVWCKETFARKANVCEVSDDLDAMLAKYSLGRDEVIVVSSGGGGQRPVR